MRLFILKFFLCLAGLLFGFAALTETAFVQNAPPKPAPTKARRSATPRPKKSVTTGNTVQGETEDEEVRTVSGSIANVAPSPTPPANSTLRGRIFYADTGRAVKRAALMLISGRGFGGPVGTLSALTDGNGAFQIKNVPAGTYYAMVNAPGVISPLAFVDLSKMRGSGEAEEFEKATEGFEKIVVDGITDAEVQIAARRGGAIGGRVMYDNGDPAIGVKVEILRKTKDKFLPVIPNFGSFFMMFMGGGGFQTDDRGFYRFAGLPAGEYIVKITENTSHSESGGGRSYNEFEIMFGGSSSLLSIFYPDVFDSKSADLIKVELGQEISEINLTIPNRGLHTVEGKIVSRKDKSPVRARLTIKREGEEDVYSIFSEMGGRREQGSASDENGNWKFKELPKGSYKLVIEPIPSEGEYRGGEYTGEYPSSNVTTTNVTPRNAPPPKPRLAKKIQIITVEDEDISEMVIELGSGATVAGTVTVENSGELPKAVTVQAVGETAELGTSDTIGGIPGMVPRTQDKNSAPDNSFRLENIAEGKTYFYVHPDDDFYVKSVKAGSVDLLAGALDLKDGDAMTNVQIILSKEMGAVKGKILDEKNDAIKNGEFVLVPTDALKQKNSSYYRDVKANEKGEFEKKVAPGEYAVVFFDQSLSSKKYEEFFKWLAEAVKEGQKITVDAGDTENLTVKKIKKQN